MRQPECYLCEKWTGDFWVEDNPVTDQHICEGCYQAALEELKKEEQGEKQNG